MRRSTRCMPSLSSPYTGIFQTCIDVSDAYTRQLNLSPLILHLPLDEQLNDADLYGLTVRLSRNKSFIKTKKNLNPPFYPCNVDPYLQRVDLCDGDAKVDSLVQSLTNSLNGDTRPGILVMFTQPPLKKEEITEYNNLTPMKTELFNQSKIRDQTIVQDFSDYRPLTGVLIKIGSITPNMHNQEAGHLHDEKSHITNGITPTVSDRLERSIVGAFCRQSVPDDVAEEILRVTFVRSIVEALCYEDTLLFYQNNRKKTSNSTKSCVLASYGCTQWYYNTSLPIISQTDIPDKDKRFVSINTGDLVLCPFVLLPTLLRRLRFSMHWDREEGSNDFIHEDTNAECSCMKKVRNNLQLQKSQLTGNGNKSNTTSALSESIQNEFYQFFTLNSKRFKGLLENNMCSLIESTPSEATLKFCIDNTRNVKNHIDQVSVSENRETKRKRTHQTKWVKSRWFLNLELCYPFWKRVFLYLKPTEPCDCDGNNVSKKENSKTAVTFKEVDEVIVTFGSQTGTAQHFAKHIVNTLSIATTVNYFLKDLSDIDFNSFCSNASKSLWIFCVATHGDGEPTDNAHDFFKHLCKANKHKVNLSHILYTVLGFGNREYEKFNAAAITLNKKLERLGATLFCDVGVADDYSDTELDVYRWVDNVLVPSVALHFKSRFPVASADLNINTSEKEVITKQQTTNNISCPVSPNHIVSYGSFISHKNFLSMPEKLLDFEPENMIAKFYSSCYGFRIETSKELLQDSSKANTSSVKHITFNLTKMYDKFKIFECSDDMIENLVPESYCPWTYSAAQTVEVVTGNDSIEVDWWFQRVFKDSGLTMNDHLYFKPMSFVYKLSFPPNTTIGNILKYFCDFSSIASRDFLKNMLHFVQDDCEKQVLKQLLNDDDYVSFIFQPMLNLREVLTLFGTSARFTTTHDLNDILKFLSIIPRKRPRPYSISSAYALDQPSLSLTVAQFVSKTTDKRIKKLPSLLELQNEIEKKSGFVCRTKTTPQSLNVSQHSETRYFYGDVSSKLCSTNILNNEHVLMSLILTNPLKKMSLKFPILLIACGTGIAPCRSIWREIHSLYKTDSSHFGEHSKVVLLYGCTHPDVDLLYKEEIQDYWQTSDACASNRNKHLFSHAFFAFSRYDKKCYVQDLIIGDAACVIKSMSTFKQFFIYVCGSNAMGKGVNESLTHVLSKKNIRRMKKKKQYIEDLWG